MLPGLSILQNHANKKSKEISQVDLIFHLLISKGITPLQIEEEFTIPDIIRFVNTEAYLRKKERESMKRK